MNSYITIRLSEEERDKLESISKKTNLTVSQLVREVVRRYLAVERFKELRVETIPYAKRAGFFADEDVLEK